jgi:hypothetical protein
VIDDASGLQVWIGEESSKVLPSARWRSNPDSSTPVSHRIAASN